MSNEVKEVEILLVEDNPTDAELCIRALKKNNLANNLVWVKDGAEALDFLFATGEYAGRSVICPPRLFCSICGCPKWMAWRCCAASRLTNAPGPSPWWC